MAQASREVTQFLLEYDESDDAAYLRLTHAARDHPALKAEEAFRRVRLLALP